MNLFIIGNGFDLAHGLQTSYGNFRDYLEEVDWSYLESLESMYGFCIESKVESVKNYLWKEFETNLSHIDETNIIEQGEQIELGLESGDIGVEDTLNTYWDEQYKFIGKLNNFVMDWIKQVDIDTQRRTDIINSDTDDLFITFNYTLLLEEIYNINKNSILHIHGSIDEDDISPVIGHGDKDKIIEMRTSAEKFREAFMEKQCSIYNAVAKYYKRTLKDVYSFIFLNKDFFRRLKDVEIVSIIGHSLGDVDMPYFREVSNNVNKDAIWNIYLYNDNEDNITKYKEKVLSIGVSEKNIRMLRSQEFFYQI